MSRRALSVLALLGAAGCLDVSELLPPARDGGQLKVPGTYLDARLSTGHRAHLALSGERQLSCRDCHALADAGFSAQAVKRCESCHQQEKEHHHPFDGGVAMGCTSCHVFRASGEAAHIDPWGCRRCHVEQLDGGAVLGPAPGEANPGHLPPHVSVHVKRCEACHRPHGAPFTQPADCGGCHDVNVSHGKGEKALVADTCMACHPHHSKASDALARCTGCHVGGPVPAKAQVKAAALFSPGHTGCSTCHAPHAFVAERAARCTSCHVEKPVLAAAKHQDCVSCHQPHEPRAAPKGCESCHQKLHPKHPVDARGQPCLGCHPIHGEVAGLTKPSPDGGTPVSSSLAVGCGACHQTPELNAQNLHARGLVCLSCHAAPHDGSPPREHLCDRCHLTQITSTRANAGHQRCGDCHPGLPHAPPVSPKPCLDCHPTKQPPQRGHVQKLECASCHQSHSAKVTTRCTDCHGTPDAPLPGLHLIPKHAQCSTCHAPHAPAPGLEPKACRSCHPQPSLKSHPTPPQQCISCHLFTTGKP